MARKRAAICKQCGYPPLDGETISLRGLCRGCAVKNMLTAIDATMKGKKGVSHATR